MTVANTKKVHVESILDFLETHHAETKTFRKVIPLGEPRADAFHFLAVLGAIGSIASIASLLWDAYEKLIVPEKDNEKENAGLMISIAPNEYRVSKLFWIGGTYKNREDFVKEFETVLTELDGSEENYCAAVDQLMADSVKWLPRSSRRSE